jgi:Cu+-exporting ATPase
MSSAFVPLAAVRREREPCARRGNAPVAHLGHALRLCVARVEGALAGVPGVLAARVNLATQRAEADVTIDAAGAASTEMAARLAAAVRETGYDAFPVTSAVADDRELREREREERATRNRFLLAASGGGAVFVIAHVGMLWPGVLPGTPWQQAAAQFALALPVQFVAGWPFLRGLWRGVVRRAPDMDTLVGLGTLAAFAYSTFALFSMFTAPSALTRHMGMEHAGRLLRYVGDDRGADPARPVARIARTERHVARDAGIARAAAAHGRAHPGIRRGSPSRSMTSSPATSCSCGPASACPWTAAFATGARASTARSSPANRCPWTWVRATR